MKSGNTASGSVLRAFCTPGNPMNTTSRRSTLLAWAAGIALLFLSLPLRADLLDTVLSILAPDYIEAKEVIACIVNKGSVDEVVAKACIEQYATQQGKQMVANDPKLKSIVDTVIAAKAGQWVRVLEIVGTDGLKTVVCSGAVSVGGAVKDLICGSVFELAKPVIKAALQAVLDGDWWELIALLGPEAACSVIPGGGVKDTLCGTLMQALNEIGSFAKGGINAGKDVLISFGETISGQTQHMPPEKYYELYWYPKVHIDVRIILNGGKPAHSIDFDACVGYFDSHKASKSSGEKWCGQMQSQLAANVNAIVPAVQSAPQAYFSGKLQAQVPRLVLENYQPDAIPKQLIIGKNWPYIKPLKNLYSQCIGDVAKMIPIPGKTPTHYDTGAPYSAWGWICDQAMLSTVKAMDTYRGIGMVALSTKLGSMGCKAKKLSESPRYYSVCDSYDGYDYCKSELSALNTKGEKHCGVDGAVATPKLAMKIAAELGTKRCAVSPKGGRNVECTRPWKQSMCKALVNQYQGSVDWVYAVTCSLKEDAGFISEQGKAVSLLAKLNGDQKRAATLEPPKQVRGSGRIRAAKACSHSYDPLAISCSGNPHALSEAKVELPACPPDPNKDGADAVCYAGPYTLSEPKEPVVAKAAAIVPPGPDLTAEAGPWLLRRSGTETMQWGGSLTISDTKALSAQDGKCYYGVHVVLVNQGTVASGQFEFSLAAQGEPPVIRRNGPLQPGGIGSHDIYVYLHPGENMLRLKIDTLGQIADVNKSNNKLSLGVNVEGGCGGRAATLAPVTGGHPPVRAH